MVFGLSYITSVPRKSLICVEKGSIAMINRSKGCFYQG